MIIRKERARLDKVYSHLYNSAHVDKTRCVYCGDRPSGMDHVPPLSMIENINIREFYSNGGEFLLYPSCKECNLTLHAYEETSIYDRLLILKARYYNKLGRYKVWTNRELGELGPTLRRYVKKFSDDEKYFLNKYTGVCNNLSRLMP